MKKLLISFFVFFTILANAVDVNTYIPKNAVPLLPVLKEEIKNYDAKNEYPWYYGGLIEQESCAALTTKQCWSATAQLKTSRERGVGLGQITVAYNPDGSVRFDSLSDLRKAHMKELHDLSWSNVVQRPDLQIRSIIIMSESNYSEFYDVKDNYQRQAMTDIAYNAGSGRVRKDRQLCSLTKGCDPGIWFDSTEKYCTASKKPIYGNRSACDIMNEHANNIFKLRMEKYKPYLQ